MINKKLMQAVPAAKPHIAKSVVWQLVGLISNIVLMVAISLFLQNLLNNVITKEQILVYAVVVLGCAALRGLCIYVANKESYLASKPVKTLLRTKIYDKTLRLSGRYQKSISTAELLQLSVDGVEQLEIYFGSYLPQFFYAMIAPVILAFVIGSQSVKVAIILFLCVPLMPIAIIAIQKFAKKLLGKYLAEYAGLADHFLENLQGLNTLKIYSSDDFQHKKMNKQAERFRVITMKVLSMQLNSIIVMDIVAYGGAALGIAFAVVEFANGNISLASALMIILLSADFFLPLRLLGSYFHVAMNGLAASKKIFTLLEAEDEKEKTKNITKTDIKLQNLTFKYEAKTALENINVIAKQNSFVCFVGKSGSGKSTLAGVLSGALNGYTGCAQIGGVNCSDISSESFAENITYIGASSYIFKGTVKENLLMAKPSASVAELWQVLEAVNLSDFLKGENGIETTLLEKGSNFSGGQCQRLALARALLHDTPMYIFDEATSNIDFESENDIMNVVQILAKTKTVLLISHRLMNVVNADTIYVLDEAKLAESGTHKSLLKNGNVYAKLWQAQQELEQVTAQGVAL